ncbi:biopolymer transport protein ExbD [Modicisalibacter ilicicola DSM 19980]|uniref:Biopolymer transport protein ExbD n=1 Tax=Modicisalibacter ilicicola DSM 19980 TaxID=1121942 RepID=A0A1M5CC29_9GAMM|nr:biopolymer transporter ExbD [Halomonas ilicicola]SHF52313.1 biopolymer transport protein ExbD [Halomonas ilicicola DSM 19980]
MKFARHRQESVDVNLTPLIDVVFLLLIFFMVSTTFDTRQALELTLPQSDSATASDTSPVTLSITRAGEYRLGEQTLSSAQVLRDALATQAASAREHGLVIEADARATHEAVVTALDQAAALGIRRVRIATRQPAAIAPDTLEMP